MEEGELKKIEELKRIVGENCFEVATEVRRSLGIELPIDDIVEIVATFKIIEKEMRYRKTRERIEQLKQLAS